jgi:hypothetical protein
MVDKRTWQLYAGTTSTAAFKLVPPITLAAVSVTLAAVSAVEACFWVKQPAAVLSRPIFG